jgi:hypothetical protein
VLATSLESVGIAAFAVALVVAIVMQAVTLRMLRRSPQ